MAIELLNNEHMSTLKGSIQNVNQELKIISPFIGFQTAKMLVKQLSAKKVGCTIVTKFKREDFLNSASSLAGLKILVEAGYKVYALKHLHSKLYLFDNSSAIIGSANFTMGGFYYNYELSLFVENELELIDELNTYFDDLIVDIKEQGDFLITDEIIEKEKIAVEDIGRRRKGKGIKYSNNKSFGAVLERKDSEEKDFVEDFLKNNTIGDIEEGVWIKFIGKGNDRIDSKKKYALTKDNRTQTSITCYPYRPTGVSKGAYIYLAAVSTDKKGTDVPIIIARARTQGYEESNKAEAGLLEQYDWMQDYPYYIRLYDVEKIDTEVENGISLIELLSGIGSDTYISTQGKNLSLIELKRRHWQKAHLKLTPYAKDYLDKRFSELVKKYGVTDN